MKMKKKQRSKNALIQFRFLRDFIKKFDDQVLLLAFGMSVIIALIALNNPQPSDWIPGTFVIIFLIATMYSWFKERMQMKSKR
jgi:uncharacterized membrane protein HdeD (DUF308 family)